MADRASGEIDVGGAITSLETLKKVAGLFVHYGLRSDYGEGTYFTVGEAMSAALDAEKEGGYLRGVDEEAKGGRFYELEGLLRELGVSYAAEAGETYECGPEVVSYTPDTGYRCVETDEDEILDTVTVEAVREVAAANPDASPETLLDGVPVKVPPLSFPDDLRASLENLRRRGWKENPSLDGFDDVLKRVADDPGLADLVTKAKEAVERANPDDLVNFMHDEAQAAFDGTKDVPDERAQDAAISDVEAFVEAALVENPRLQAAMLVYDRTDAQLDEILSRPLFREAPAPAV